MATDESSETAGRSRVRIALVVGCVLAAVLAALLTPTLATGGLAGTPIDSVLPGERFEDGSGAGAGGGSGEGFGALTPGDRTGVGGDTGFDNETFGANDTEIHFEVESTEAAYWRTGSYDTYTGTGWERSGDEMEFVPPLEPVGLTDGNLEFEVTLAEPATAVPTAWQPQDVSGVEEVQLTEDRAIRSSGILESGTTISGVSQLQENDVDVLRAAGVEYPAGVSEQYTQLPADTPDRVEVFTDELTADDETPYDAAMTVQSWLRTEKEYSLEASRQSDHIADTFIFEMEAGYCEYFATAMTTMLRSQDIPARYTIGYSTGQPIGDNTYEVRGMNAHAWVEVYFPDVGWVQFDPTPGSSRLSTQSAVLEEELDEEFELEEPGSPGETFEPGEVTTPDETEETDEAGDDEYGISLNRTAVPGLPVEIEVTRAGSPVSDMVVTVNDEEVGTTDDSGIVTITVPEDDELRISVRPGEVVFDTNPPLERAGESPPVPSTVPNSDERLFSDEVEGATLLRTPEDNRTTDERNQTVEGLSPASFGEETNTTVDIETTATLSVTGTTLPGETVTVTATVGDVSIPDAMVRIDGEEVGTTDESGRAEVALPDESGNVTLSAERGAVSGEETVRLPELDIAVSTGAIALPFTTATATVSAGEEDISGAPVVVDGDEVETTGASGTADIRLPLSLSATVETSAHGMSDSAVVDGLARNLGLVAAGAVVLVAALLGVVRRRDPSLDGIVNTLAASVEWLLLSSQLALLGAVRNGGPWLASLPGRARQKLVTLLDVARGRVTVTELRSMVLAWFTAKRHALSRDEPGAEAGTAQPSAVSGGIQRAWATFLARLSISDPSAYTPGELAAHAVEVDDLPAEPVETLLTAFRAVEYGSQPERAQLDRAERALARLDTQGSGAEGNAPSRRPLQEEAAADGGTEQQDGGES